MSKFIANPYAPEGNYSRFLENEFNKSLQFQKKHVLCGTIIGKRNKSSHCLLGDNETRESEK